MSSMDTGRDPIARRSFEELAVGDRFDLPSRTMTEAHFALFQALSGDNHEIHYDVEWCKERGWDGMLAHGLQVLTFTAAGAGPFPTVVEDHLLGFIEQSSRFRGPVYPGDTLQTRLEITKLEGQRTTGVVTVGVEVRNQRDEIVLDGEQRYLLRLAAAASTGS